MLKRRFAIVALFLISATVLVFAASDAPGSESDPVVTKSYIDQRISGVTAFAPLEIKEGQSLVGQEGAELILRSGEATAIGGVENGIADLTGGADLLSGAAISMNHLLLIPRSDGRGITANTDIWVMIKGGYSIDR